MPEYRVEVSPTGRAGCSDGLCKKNGVKIAKGEIRFGVWVEGVSHVGHEFQSFRWRHWGCVSGKTLQNIRENLGGALADEGEYKWDLLDGLDEMPSSYQEKIKLAITEGKIADEDWRGDPAYNVLGKVGIRGHASPKKKVEEEDEERGNNVSSPETPVKPRAKKRARVKDEGEEEEEAKPVKKQATKVKKEGDGEDESNPSKKPRAKKATKGGENRNEDEQKPEKKPRARKSIKNEDANEAVPLKKEQAGKLDPDLKPVKKTGAKKGTKKQQASENFGVKKEENDSMSIDAQPATKARVKNAAKEESVDENQIKEENESVNIDIKPIKKPRGKKVTKKERADEPSHMKKEEDDAHDTKNVKSIAKHRRDGSSSGMKENHDVKAEMPEDPLEQISLAFCDRDGPLVSDFNQMVEAQEVSGDDWDGFLQKKFRNLVKAGEVADNDFRGFLQKMHRREMAANEPEAVASKKIRRGKPGTTTAVNPRARRGKAS